MPVLLVGVALVGLVVGSFLNVVIHRVPAGGSVVHPPSSCPACGHRVRHRHNVPLLGWLLLRGRCAHCAGRISVRYPAVEVLTATLFVALALRVAQLDAWAAAPALLFFCATGIALGAIDLESRRLPDRIVLPAYPVLALLLGLAAVIESDPEALVRAGAGAVASSLGHYALAFAVPGGMGLGDVKLAGLTGAVLAHLSWPALLVGVAAPFLLAGAVATAALLARRAGRGSALPFGPFMVGGAFVGLLAAGPVLDASSRLVGRA